MNRYEALRQAVEAHAGQKDKCGRDYVLHPIAVAEAVDRGLLGEFAVCMALLHDVWEDTDHRILGLTDLGMTTLDALTHRQDEVYMSYIDRCAGDWTAAHVKLADLWHNLQPERQGGLPEKEAASLERRYLKARARIWEALGREWWPA